MKSESVERAKSGREVLWSSLEDSILIYIWRHPTPSRLLQQHVSRRPSLIVLRTPIGSCFPRSPAISNPKTIRAQDVFIPIILNPL